MPQPHSMVSLDYLRKHPKVREDWRHQRVRIWSGEWEQWWRANGAGYTGDSAQAGVYDFEDAYERTCHCDDSKRIVYHLIKIDTEHRDLPVCPFCGEMYDRQRMCDLSQYQLSLLFAGKLDLICTCGKNYKVERAITVTYTTRKP